MFSYTSFMGAYLGMVWQIPILWLNMSWCLLLKIYVLVFPLSTYAMLLSYSQMLPFDAKPDYHYISRLFGGSVPHEGTHPVFDWDSGLAHIDTPYTKPLPPIIASCMCKSQVAPICCTG